MRVQRDKAWLEAPRLRHRIRIAALVMVVTTLLVVGAVAYVNECLLLSSICILCPREMALCVC
jgi:hypothetical protein